MASDTISSFKRASLCSLMILGSSLVLTGCGEDSSAPQAEQSTMKTLNTQVTYLDRSMLPPGSVLKVQLADVSKMDAKADVLSEQEIELNGAPPYSVELEYDESKIADRHRYSVSARIENQGKLLYISTTHNNPFAEDVSGDVYKVTVTKVSAKKPDVTLTNTYWKAVTISGETITVENKEPFVQFKDDGSTSGYLGCNNFSGNYEVNEQMLTFKPLAITERMCVAKMDIEAAMSATLAATAKYSINGEQLTLLDDSDEPLATFAATYMN
ncbi:MAG: META domain-containing protein [Pseudoalteromonas sp.]|uniref:META domain-containing protein n=1 Tax=Pseudoalteromonas sp. TaxID=53249 RepID=UPI000C8B1BEE|nr:META domain-containing protein [Pseudoalteromonas sp.]MAD04632.1 META domain-containing protein [Pseudoalteromonas sp.]|tara:strand:- start:12369 stop:13178 length:810 start_codon:yes stop_codon:yes gene_type:complete